MKKKKPRIPIRMWAVCYPDTGSETGWMPYSGSLFYDRRDADNEAIGTTKAVMSVMVYPTGYVRKPRS